MIIKKSQVPAERAERESFGVTDTVRLSMAGGLSQYGAYVQTLHPGARSSNNHWHENEDEFLYVLSGEVTVTEQGQAEVLGPRIGGFSMPMVGTSNPAPSEVAHLEPETPWDS